MHCAPLAQFCFQQNHPQHPHSHPQIQVDKSHYLGLVCWNNHNDFLPAIIVTGGYSSKARVSVEVLHGDGTPWCTLPDLPEYRYYHTQTGLEACGGGDSGSASLATCVRFSGDSWTPSHQLQQRRYMHSSWASLQGTVLMGGYWGGDTTELLEDSDGDSTMHFSLKYDTE